jgi:Ni/Fe-hydrogenase subunit HybB-like protein
MVKAMDPRGDVLLAFEMNGQTLPKYDHHIIHIHHTVFVWSKVLERGRSTLIYSAHPHRKLCVGALLTPMFIICALVQGPRLPRACGGAWCGGG